MSFFLKKRIINCFRKKKYTDFILSDDLSQDEKKILEKISVGKSYNTIADELNISKADVQKIIRVIYQKLQQIKIQ